MTITEIIDEAIRSYRNSGVTLNMPQMEQISIPNAIRPSSLGRCTLQAAREKMGVRPDHAGLTLDASGEKQWIADHGNYIAPAIQLPLMYLALTSAHQFMPEVAVTGKCEGWLVNGRADGILDDCVVEVKNTEDKKKRDYREPSINYALQTLVYMRVLGLTRGAVVLVNKWGYDVYDLVERDIGWQLEKDGIRYVSRFEDWNTPERLNYDQIGEELTQIAAYMAMIDGGMDLSITPPIEDPLNHPMGWLCIEHVVKPKDEKLGLLRPRCPFAERCHHIQARDYVTLRQDDKIILRPEF